MSNSEDSEMMQGKTLSIPKEARAVASPQEFIFTKGCTISTELEIRFTATIKDQKSPGKAKTEPATNQIKSSK